MSIITLVRRLAGFLFAALAFGAFTSPAQALNPVPFSGGTCTLIDSQANGVRVDFCTNLSGKTVNDIHVTFSHQGLPNSTIDYDQAFLCSFTGTCFGPAVAPGGRWEGGNGNKGDVENPTLWSAGTIALAPNFNLNTVTATGYWTSGGTQVTPVPEPATWAMMIASFAMLGAALRRRQRGSASAATI